MSAPEKRVSQFLDALQRQGAPSGSLFLGSFQPQQPVEEEGGTLGNIAETIISPLAAPFSAEARQRLMGVGAGVLSGAVLDPATALLQIPGLFSKQELMTDRAADFVARAKQGLYSLSEERAMDAGMTQKEIADAHAIGNFIGFIAPVTASVKAASFLLRAPINTTKILTRSNLVNDLTAGALFGAILEPGESFDERTKHLLRESAMFGVGRIMIAGIALPWRQFRNSRLVKLGREEEVTSMIKKMENGHPVTVESQEQAISLGQLLTEEDMVTSSFQAQELVRNTHNERALLQGVMTANETGASGGLMRDFGADLQEVTNIVGKFRQEMPGMKFEILRSGEDKVSVYFGTKPLSHTQRQQYLKHQRFQGQQVEKGGTIYEVVNPEIAKDGKISVLTSDGKKTRIMAKGLSDIPGVVEAPDFSNVADDLFENFRSQVFSNWQKIHAQVQGDLPEGDLIRAIRDGRIKMDNNSRRAFDVSGAIVYPEELGRLPQGALATVEDVLQIVPRDGTRSARFLTDGGSVISFEEMAEAWARSNELPIGAPDWPAMKSHFAQRLREHMWKQVPEDDMKILNAIREEQLKLFDKGDLPFESIAHSKGFTADNLEGGRKALRDMRTGMRIELGSEQRAREFLSFVVRSDKNSLGDPFNMGSAGITAVQKGFNVTDGIFTMDGTMPSAKIFLDDIPATSGIQNVRDMLQRIEDAVGVPVFTGVFDGLDQASTRWHQAVEPWATRVGKVWEPLNTKEAIQVGKLWAQVDGTEMTQTQAIALFKSQGLSQKQITAFVESRKIFDTLFHLTGIENKRYVNLYYSRVLPWAQKHGGMVDLERIFGAGQIPPEFRPFMLESRTGEMSIQEANPAIVLHKYIRTLFFQREVNPTFSKARDLVRAETTPRFRDLSPAQRQAIETTAGKKFGDNEPVLADPIRQVLSEYLNVIRGMPTATQKSFRDWGVRFYKALGIEVEERVIDEMANIGLSSMYGAAMAFRPALIARNLTQSLWTMYPRVGAKHYSRALDTALTREGAEEAMLSGADRMTDAGVPFGDQAYRSLMDAVPIKGTGPMSRAVAATMRQAMRLGDVSRRVARTGLLPYTSTDGVERATVYWWQKLHTDEALLKYEKGKGTWDDFMEEGLPFFHNVTKQKFGQLYNRLGREEALRWIGKQAADEANFIYGAGAQPAWMQSAPGRFLGMFGTWPMWAFELYGRRVRNGSPKQIAAFTARTLALVGAFTNIGIQSGVQMEAWISPASVMGYAGGPVLDNIIQMKRVIDAPLDQKGDALKMLATQVGRLSMPGQLAYVDVRDALDTNDPAQAALRMMLGRPIDDGGNFALDKIYDPSNTGFQLQFPESEDSLRSLQGLSYPKIPLTQEEGL
jgi:hypothetical protein